MSMTHVPVIGARNIESILAPVSAACVMGLTVGTVIGLVLLFSICILQENTATHLHLQRRPI